MNINDLFMKIEESRILNSGSLADCKNLLGTSDDIYNLSKIEQIELFFGKLKNVNRNKQKIILNEIFGEYI